MQFAEGPNSGLNARFTSSLRTALEAFEQWLLGGGVKNIAIAVCDFFDINNDGTISYDELEQLFVSCW